MDKFEIAMKNLPEIQIWHYEPISNRTKTYFSEIKLPHLFYTFFEKHSFSNFIQFNNIIYDKVNDFIDINTEVLRFEDRKRYLIIGHGLNGDPIAINMETLSIGFIFHDILFEDKNTNIDEIFMGMNYSIEDFYYNAIFENNFPCDAYEAKVYHKNSQTARIGR
jgi:hypothetical protein